MVAVVEDPQLRSALDLLKGEWQETSGAQFETADARGAGRGADLLVFPPVMLGDLCEQAGLRPVRESVLVAQSLDFSDFYSHVRDKLLTYGGQTMALPLGCPTPLLTAASNVQQDDPSLTTWPEIAIPSSSGAGQPGWAVRFLAHAAPYAYHESREAFLFDSQSMKPRINQPPFVRALRELAAAPRTQSPALMLPARPRTQPTDADAPLLRVSPVPSVEECYNPLSKEWEPPAGGARRVVLLGVRGRLVGVTTTSRNAAAAFRLAGWLAGRAHSQQLSTASPNVACVRRSLARVSDDWTGGGSRALGRQFSTALDESWRTQRVLALPRMIHAENYLKQLDAAIAVAVQQQQPPQQALDQIAKNWDQITEQVGRERQQKAYLRHLGVMAYAPPTR